MEWSQKLSDCVNIWSEPIVNSCRIGGESLGKEGAAAEWIYNRKIQTETQRSST